MNQRHCRVKRGRDALRHRVVCLLVCLLVCLFVCLFLIWLGKLALACFVFVRAIVLEFDLSHGNE